MIKSSTPSHPIVSSISVQPACFSPDEVGILATLLMGYGVGILFSGQPDFFLFFRALSSMRSIRHLRPWMYLVVFSFSIAVVIFF